MKPGSARGFFLLKVFSSPVAHALAHTELFDCWGCLHYCEINSENAVLFHYEEFKKHKLVNFQELQNKEVSHLIFETQVHEKCIYGRVSDILLKRLPCFYPFLQKIHY